MDQAHVGDNFALTPGPAHEDQAGFIGIDLHVFAFVAAGVAGFDDMLHFIGPDDLQKVSGGLQVLTKVLLQKIRHQLGIDVTIFELHRHAFFAMHTDQMKNRRAGGQCQGGGHRHGSRLASQVQDAAGVAVTSSEDFVSDVGDAQQIRLRFAFGDEGAYA